MEFISKMANILRTGNKKEFVAEQEANRTYSQVDAFQDLYQKYHRVDINEIDYIKSPHSMSIQNSKFVKIENNRERILRQHLKIHK